MKKVLTVPNLASKVLEMVPALKQKMYIYNKNDYICKLKF